MFRTVWGASGPSAPQEGREGRWASNRHRLWERPGHPAQDLEWGPLALGARLPLRSVCRRPGVAGDSHSLRPSQCLFQRSRAPKPF